jgi:hypothetical protein
MLTRQSLAELVKAHENEWILSVYLGRDGSDPGARAAWKLRLDHALETIGAEAPHDATGDASAFDSASRHVRSAVEAFGRVLPHDGWAAFATADALLHAEGLSFVPSDLVRWRPGICAAPYVRALKGRRPVILALLDGWHAHLFEYLEGTLTPIQQLHVDRTLDDASDVGMSKRAGTTTGTRGLTRTDYAQRALDEESKRLKKQSVESILARAGVLGGVVVGGTAKPVAAVKADLEKKVAVVEVTELSFNSSLAQLTEATAKAASELTRARQRRLYDACAESPQHGSLGWDRTRSALESGAVDTLLIARGVMESSPDEAEQIVRMALAQGADVEEVGEEVGERLVRDSEGVAARLRFNVSSGPDEPSSASRPPRAQRKRPRRSSV